MKKQIALHDLVEKLNKNKAFPVYKKKITKDDLKLVFTDKELRKKSSIKSYILIFGIFVAITGLFSLDFVRLIVGLIFAVGSFFYGKSQQKVFEK